MPEHPSSATCPICTSAASRYANVDAFDYFECSHCDALFLDPAVLEEVDRGRSLVQYSEPYWKAELDASRARSYGSSLARVAETFLYARRPIDVFLDIGAGAGFLLEACATYLPASKQKFYGIEKYPPRAHSTQNSNFVVGEIPDLQLRVDAGCCIEVIEHLTPVMLSKLLHDLSAVANQDALFIINSGQPAFVKHEDPRYLDPCGRGHLVSYSVKSIAHLAEPHGFRVHALPGKTWALLLEKSASRGAEHLVDRIWTPVPKNAEALNDPTMGSLMYVLGVETARAYG